MSAAEVIKAVDQAITKHFTAKGKKGKKQKGLFKKPTFTNSLKKPEQEPKPEQAEDKPEPEPTGAKPDNRMFQKPEAPTIEQARPVPVEQLKYIERRRQPIMRGMPRITPKRPRIGR